MTTFYKDPIVQIVEELNEKNKDTLTRPLEINDLVFTEVSNNPTTGEREVIARAASWANYYGTIRNPGVKYKRYLGHKLFMVAPRVSGSTGDSYADIAMRLAEEYNLPPFKIQPSEDSTKQDYDLPFSLHSRTIDNEDWSSVEVTLVFEPTSIGYFGGVTVNVYNAERDLSQIVVNRSLDGLVYPDDTKGETGSLSTLTYPVKWAIPEAGRAILSEVGQTLPAEENDPIIVAMIDSIVNFYVLEDAEANTMSTALLSVLPGSKVLSTNLAATGELTGEEIITLEAKPADGVPWIGTVYIRGPEFY
ncbi:virion structural protein [Salmonella phage SPLA10]|nr:virion structural protein [Salmonella phage SPLA10]